MTSEVDSLPKVLDLICMIIYSVFFDFLDLFTWIECFLLWTESYTSFKNQFNCWVVANYPCLALLDLLGGFLHSKALFG